MIWEPGKTYTMRNGYSATVWEIAPQQDFPVIGAYNRPGGERNVARWAKTGGYLLDMPSDFDLLPPEPRKRTVWVNVYGEFDGLINFGIGSHESKQDAEGFHSRFHRNPRISYLGAFPIEIVEPTP